MNIRRFTVLIVILLYILILIPYQSQASQENIPKWTFMVYMDADNSLYSYAPSDLKEMMSVGSNSKLNIIVLYDSIKYNDSAIYYIEKGRMKIIKRLGEVDMGSPQTLEFFINWTINKYPAEHYFLDFWDHGDFYGGVCLDHGDWLTLKEMRCAIVQAENNTGKIIDVIGFDACRMGILENFYALRNLTYYVVASEKDEPATGWPYNMVLKNITNYTPQEEAYNVVNAMYNWSKENFAQKGLSTTMVAVNMTRFNKFMGIFNEDLRDALDVASYYSSELVKYSQETERYEAPYDMDLYNFMENIEKINDYKIDKLAKDTMRELDYISYYKVWNCPQPDNGIHAKYSHGIGIYFPTFVIAPSYYSIDFAKDTYWPQFLNKIFNPNIVKSKGVAKYSLSNGTLKIEYNANVSAIKIYIVSYGNLYNYSGELPSEGVYKTYLDFGEYHIYIYGYNGTNVVWVYNFSLTRSKVVRIEGRFYFNGAIARGAKIYLTVKNVTYETLQNDTGFSFYLLYPQQIYYNSSIEIKVVYGSFSKIYHLSGETLRGNDTLYFTIEATSGLFNCYLPFILISLVILGAVLIILYTRRFRG